jgi:hypothetical protein
MTVVVGYEVDGVYRFAADTRWTIGTTNRTVEGSKLYRAGPWMFGESGDEALLTTVRRRLTLDKKIRNRDLSYLQDVIHTTAKEYKEECWILTYHPDFGVNAISEAGRVTPSTARYLAVGSGAPYVAAFINGLDWNAFEGGSVVEEIDAENRTITLHPRSPSYFRLDDIHVEAAIATAAWLDTTVGGYELMVYE